MGQRGQGMTGGQQGAFGQWLTGEGAMNAGQLASACAPTGAWAADEAIFVGSEIYRGSSYGGLHPLRVPRVSTVIVVTLGVAFAVVGIWLGGSASAVSGLISIINSYIPGIIGKEEGQGLVTEADVAEGLARFVERTRVDEVIVASSIYDPAARKRSLEITMAAALNTGLTAKQRTDIAASLNKVLADKIGRAHV